MGIYEEEIKAEKRKRKHIKFIGIVWVLFVLIQVPYILGWL